MAERGDEKKKGRLVARNTWKRRGGPEEGNFRKEITITKMGGAITDRQGKGMEKTKQGKRKDHGLMPGQTRETSGGGRWERASVIRGFKTGGRGAGEHNQGEDALKKRPQSPPLQQP